MRFSQVDVFTDELTLGNPVAVVHDAESVTDDQMAAFARWTNLSETTFLLPPTDPAADYRVRIFSTHDEMPFAGHPTLGTARAWLAAGGAPRTAGQLVQECGVGLVRVREDAGRLAFAAPPLLRSGPVDAADVDQAVRRTGVDPSLVLDAQWVDNGPGWVALLLQDAAAVLALEPGPAPEGGIGRVGVVGAHPAGAGTAYEVRAFTRSPGGEDPATGSLNASVAQWLIGAGLAPDSYVASQGTRIGRRARIHVDRVGDDVWVGGDTVVGITGSVGL